VFLLAGVATRGAGRGRNECVAFSPEGQLLARYCKMQPFTLGGEAAAYEAGAAALIFQCGELSVAPFICCNLSWACRRRSSARSFCAIASLELFRADACAFCISSAV